MILIIIFDDYLSPFYKRMGEHMFCLSAFSQSDMHRGYYNQALRQVASLFNNTPFCLSTCNYGVQVYANPCVGEQIMNV